MSSLLKLLISNRMRFYLVLLVLITYIFILLLYVQRRSTSQSKRKKMNYNRAIDYYCATAKNRLLSHNDNYISPHIKFRLYIIVHNSFSQEIAEKWSNCMPFVTIIRIPTTFFFESIVYQRSLYTLRDEWKHLDLVGLATYKSLKFSPLEKLKAYIELAYYKPYDVVPLYSAGEQLVSLCCMYRTPCIHIFIFLCFFPLQFLDGSSCSWSHEGVPDTMVRNSDCHGFHYTRNFISGKSRSISEELLHRNTQGLGRAHRLHEPFHRNSFRKPDVENASIHKRALPRSQESGCESGVRCGRLFLASVHLRATARVLLPLL